MHHTILVMAISCKGQVEEESFASGEAADRPPEKDAQFEGALQLFINRYG